MPETTEATETPCPKCGKIHSDNEPFQFDDRGVEQITREEAAALAANNYYEKLSPAEIVDKQLYQRRFFTPEKVLVESLSTVLGRKVLSSELAFQKRLVAEVKGERPAPTKEEQEDMVLSMMLDSLSAALGDPAGAESQLHIDLDKALKSIGAKKLFNSGGVQAYSISKGN